MGQNAYMPLLRVIQSRREVIMALQIQNVSKSYGVDLVFENISMNIADNEKVGLIGVNGAGKTTLLNIISGELSYDSGTIFKSKDSRIGFLKQNSNLYLDKTIWATMMSVFDDVVAMESELRNLEQKMSTVTDETEHERILKSYGAKSEQFEKMGGFELRAKIMTILNGMGFENFDLNMQVDKLSGGEKTKLAMARLLLENPEILLLDEPTNHLDFKTMQWLESYLKTYKGAVITVSHDRYFLDSLVTTIYEIERNKCTRYTGNYTKYLETKKHNYEIALKHFNEQQREIKRLEDYIDKNSVRASTAKSAKSKQKAIDRMEIIEKPDGELSSCSFGFEMEYPSYKDVLTVSDLTLMVEKSGILTPIAQNINFNIKRGEKVALIGANGIGKSTLIKTLLDKHTSYSGEFEFGNNVQVSYYDQDQKLLDNKKTVIDEIWDRLPRLEESQIRSLLARILFCGDDVFKLIKDLSGGERARLMLLIIMIEKANTLFLDEPTNHLDLGSKESLDVAVKKYQGTVFFVSHDRYFLNKIADKIFELTPDGINRYEGNYDDYLRTQNISSVFASEKKSENLSARTYEEEKRRQANIKNKTKKLELAEKTIEETENKIEELNLSLEAVGSDYDKVKEIYSEIEKCNELLTLTYESWGLLNEELEILKKDE